MTSLKQAPDGMSPIAAKAFEVLAAQTSFPGPVLITQLRRHGQDPAWVDADGLALAAEDIATGVGRFTSPQKAQTVRAALAALLVEAAP